MLESIETCHKFILAVVAYEYWECIKSAIKGAYKSIPDIVQMGKWVELGWREAMVLPKFENLLSIFFHLKFILSLV